MNTNIEYKNIGDLIEELQHELTIWKECADGLQEAYERKDKDALLRNIKGLHMVDDSTLSNILFELSTAVFKIAEKKRAATLFYHDFN